jgi:hypothetical protein
MPEEIGYDRCRFFGTAAIKVAAAQIGEDPIETKKSAYAQMPALAALGLDRKRHLSNG